MSDIPICTRCGGTGVHADDCPLRRDEGRRQEASREAASKPAGSKPAGPAGHLHPDTRLAFNIFMVRLRARLEAGARTYGERSSAKSGPELADEIAEELLDICGWAVILWRRLMELRPHLKRLEDPLDTGPTTD